MTTRVVVCLGIGLALAAAPPAGGAPALPVPKTQDVNGDGRDDLVLYGVDSTGASIPQPPWPVRVAFGKRDNAPVDVRSPGSWGQVLEGPFGWGASTVGDVNGDGRADLLVASVGPDPGALIVHGQPATGTITAGAPGSAFTIGGRGLTFGNDFFVFGIGDVNGDGFEDLGAVHRHERPDAVRTGHALWVIYGGAQATHVDVDRLGTRGTRIRVPPVPRRWNFAGLSLSGAGDVDADGIDDLAVGATAYPGPSCVVDTGGTGQRCNGRVWVIYGRKLMPRRIDVAKLGRSGLVVANRGRSAADRRYSNLGSSSSAAGDLDGDGFEDLLVEVEASFRRGTGLVIWGARRARRPRRIVVGARTSRLPAGHVPIGDFDGDGRADLLGLPDRDLEERSNHRAFVLRGRRWTGLRRLDPRRRADGHRLFSGSVGFRIPGAAAGDVNGDGYADVKSGGQFLGDAEAIGAVLVFGSSERDRVRGARPRGFRFGLLR